MKRIGYLLLLVVASCLASCGGGEPVIVRPTTSKVTGALSGNFEVVVRDYKLSDGKLSVEFKRIGEGNPIGVSWSVQPTFFVELLDEDGNSIASAGVADQGMLENVIALNVDETASVPFKFDETKGAVKFRVTSKYASAGESAAPADTVLTFGDVIKAYGVLEPQAKSNPLLKKGFALTEDETYRRGDTSIEWMEDGCAEDPEKSEYIVIHFRDELEAGNFIGTIDLEPPTEVSPDCGLPDSYLYPVWTGMFADRAGSTEIAVYQVKSTVIISLYYKWD